MIVFDLRCDAGHLFEAWFASGDAYAAQRAAGQLACPLCGSGAVDKAVMAPAVAGPSAPSPRPAPVAFAAKFHRRTYGTLNLAADGTYDYTAISCGAGTSRGHAGDRAFT